MHNTSGCARGATATCVIGLVEDVVSDDGARNGTVVHAEEECIDGIGTV